MHLYLYLYTLLLFANLSDASAVVYQDVFDNHCSPGTSSSLRALSARLLQCAAGWCCWCSSEAPQVSIECCSSTHVRISPLRSHYASPRTSALVAGSSKNRLQDGGTGVESSARCSSGVFVGLLCSSGHGVRSTASIRSATAGVLMVPRARTTTGQRSFAVKVQASSENILAWTLAIIDWRCCDC